jgi:alkylation response protein AidB-like acyl-CoA dehydrogenase
MTTAVGAESATSLREWWRLCADPAQVAATDDPAVAATLLRALVTDGSLDLPLPGAGRTRGRFDALTALGELDLTVARLAEAHADALAILAELGSDSPRTASDVWAVWAAEPPSARVVASPSNDGWRLDGRKAWCSGAGGSSQALVTAHGPDGPRLFAVDLAQPGVTAVDDPWPTHALTGTDTRSVDFAGASARPVGAAGDYVGRPGFWHGAVGVAAVWLGGAIGVAQRILVHGRKRQLDDIDAVHLGAVGTAIAGARATLHAAADSFDADPRDETGRAVVTARSTRAVVEAAALEVIDRAGRALGPGPLALEPDHARRVADLQLYLRQSHADRDLADLGYAMLETGSL